jgi:hypothetical protein
MSKRIDGINLLVCSFLMTITLALVLGSLVYDGKQRLVALVIGFPTIGMLAFLMLASLIPPLLAYLRPLGLSEDDAPEAESEGPANNLNTGTWRRVAIVYGWLIGYYVLTFVLGYYVATPVFLVAFLTRESGLTLMRSLGVMVASLVPFYVIFRLILDIPLWPGVLPRILPGILGGGSIPQLN